MAGGRPTKFKPEFAKQAEKLCKLGATDIELADFFGINVRTLYRWTQEHREFCQALKVSKHEADARVERSLFSRATGYTYEAVKIFQYEGDPVVVPYREHVPPDTTAAIFWLKNRKPEEWREKVTNEHTFPDVDSLSDQDVAALVKRLGSRKTNGHANGDAGPSTTH